MVERELDERDHMLLNALKEMGGSATFNKWFNYVKEKYGITSVKAFKTHVDHLYDVGLIEADPPRDKPLKKGKPRKYSIKRERIEDIYFEFLKALNRNVRKEYEELISGEPLGKAIYIISGILEHEVFETLVLAARFSSPEILSLWKIMLKHSIDEALDVIVEKSIQEYVNKEKLLNELKTVIDVWYNDKLQLCEIGPKEFRQKCRMNWKKRFNTTLAMVEVKD